MSIHIYIYVCMYMKRMEQSIQHKNGSVYTSFSFDLTFVKEKCMIQLSSKDTLFLF